MIKVGYDAGHGGFGVTPGKRSPDGEYEWDFNNKVAKAFAKELALYKGVTAKRFDDPSGERDVPLQERTDEANSWGANYYISFHHNANTSSWGTWSGVETYVYVGNKSTISGRLAQAIHPSVVRAYGLRDRGIKEADFHILRETNMPAILIEGGFMDSTIDIKKLRDDRVLENAGKIIAQSFANFVGLKRITFGNKEEEEMAQFLNKTGRAEAKEMIQRGVEEKLFHDKHENVDEYDDIQLLSFALAYVNRKLKS
ncbi:N-acetylmuramoyl-L-alanine amidase family protein [Ureibacillus acetophenoni]|uniref:N-acetylmuramoyl-L-alanine amidase n=1 Tax=Ureibacillus acetophenoni TaxID=614649 RepID=A0A285TZY8_9BACL|nr:N-acetylmuramoyl-L-alanine amidase [Ureibacillus acetophenoni]SOC35149.1 N-acetylmuramoyl-L-alanine amidase [Ureibacillus acetophenoni]